MRWLLEDEWITVNGDELSMLSVNVRDLRFKDTGYQRENGMKNDKFSYEYELLRFRYRRDARCQ